jgi:UDP-glucose 4-epimerase
VDDLVQAIFCCIERGTSVAGKTFELSDGNTYSSSDFSRLIRNELGRPWVMRVRCPLIVLKMICFVAEKWARLWGKTSTLNLDKYKIMKQRNWRCSIDDARETLGYKPAYDLARGVRETINWYKRHRWL